jgi:hypothetical protein
MAIDPYTPSKKSLGPNCFHISSKRETSRWIYKGHSVLFIFATCLYVKSTVAPTRVCAIKTLKRAVLNLVCFYSRVVDLVPMVMEYGKHWRQRLSVTIRGRVMVYVVFNFRFLTTSDSYGGDSLRRRSWNVELSYFHQNFSLY